MILVLVAAAIVVLRLFLYQPPVKPAHGDLQNVRALVDAIKTVTPDAATVTVYDNKTVQIKDRDGKPVGYAVDTTGMPGLVEGYLGKVPVVIVLSSDGTIVGTAPLANQETPSYIDKVKAKGLFNAFNGLKPTDALARQDVDAVSGATYTSMAVLSAARAGFGSVSHLSFKPAPAYSIWTVGNAAALLVILFGLICWLKPRKFRRMRPLLLVADVVILGFLQGAMLSTALFSAWIGGEPGLILRANNVILLTVLALSILLPLITGRHFWCSQLCPFGAASELATKIPVKRFAMKAGARKVLRIVGLVYLSGILGILVVWPGLDLASFEPFAAFSLTAAPIASIVIAIVFLVISMFCPRLWCRFLCPTGKLLEAFTIGIPADKTGESCRNAPAGKCSELYEE